MMGQLEQHMDNSWYYCGVLTLRIIEHLDTCPMGFHLGDGILWVNGYQYRFRNDRERHLWCEGAWAMLESITPGMDRFCEKMLSDYDKERGDDEV